MRTNHTRQSPNGYVEFDAQVQVLRFFLVSGAVVGHRERPPFPAQLSQSTEIHPHHSPCVCQKLSQTNPAVFARLTWTAERRNCGTGQVNIRSAASSHVPASCCIPEH